MLRDQVLDIGVSIAVDPYGDPLKGVVSLSLKIGAVSAWLAIRGGKGEDLEEVTFLASSLILRLLLSRLEVLHHPRITRSVA
jgi:hypothetical protein